MKAHQVGEQSIRKADYMKHDRRRLQDVESDTAELFCRAQCKRMQASSCFLTFKQKSRCCQVGCYSGNISGVTASEADNIIPCVFAFCPSPKRAHARN